MNKVLNLEIGKLFEMSSWDYEQSSIGLWDNSNNGHLHLPQNDIIFLLFLGFCTKKSNQILWLIGNKVYRSHIVILEHIKECLIYYA